MGFANNRVAFASELGLVVNIDSIDFLTQTAYVSYNGEKYNVSVETLEQLDLLGVMNGLDIFDGDIFEMNEEIYSISRHKDDKEMLVLTKLDENLDDLVEGKPFSPASLGLLSDYLAFKGNVREFLHIIEQEVVVDLDFNIIVVKDIDNGVYYYAGNNKSAEEVDLIAVSFVGHKLLEKDYERITVSHEDYKDMVIDEVLVEVNPNELMSLLNKASYSTVKSSEYVENAEDIEDDTLADDDCGMCNGTDDCTCW